MLFGTDSVTGTLGLGRYLVLWYALVLHACWGIVLVFDESAQHATAVAYLNRWCLLLLNETPKPLPVPGAVGDLVLLPPAYHLLSFLLLAVSGLALLAITHGRRFPFQGLELLLPQQFFLTMSGVGAVEAVCTGRFADGTVRPWALILCDQLPALLAAALHTLALLDYYLWGRPKKLPVLPAPLTRG